MRTSKLNSLTGLRGTAALMIVIYHSLLPWPHDVFTRAVTELGFMGVQFFFCLSGFVMQWTWREKQFKVIQFLIKRVARIYPVAILGLCISFFSFKLFQTPLAGYVGGRHSISMSALLVQSWLYNKPDVRQSWDGVSWTLSCEIFFYLVSPLTVPLINKLNLRATITSFIVAVLAYYAWNIIETPKPSYAALIANNFFTYSPLGNLPLYLLGSLLARILITSRGISYKFNVPVIFLLSIIIPLFLAHDYYNIAYANILALSVIPGFLLIILVSANNDLTETRRRPDFLHSKPLLFLGNISFSLYMMHALVLGAFCLALAHLHVTVSSAWLGDVLTVAYFVVSVLVAAAVYYCVEEPVYAAAAGLLPAEKRKATFPTHATN
jgi:mycarose O-acyltransferase